MGQFQAIRGMHDLLPADSGHWQAIEGVIRGLTQSYGYQEIRFPILEQTALFARTIGENTDIVEKEMYTFEDRNGDSLTLRPEGTAPCVRAAIQSGILHNQMQRLWYMGPMFRHERPQKGRTRQFHQFGIEIFNMPGADADVEVILLSARLFKQLGILNNLRLEINTLGLLTERQQYKDDLVAYLTKHIDKLDADSQKRLQTNPLRILDSKNPDVQALLKDAPDLFDYLGETSKSHFQSVCDLLDIVGLPYTINHRLVRGLDYYAHTVFEWITDDLGAQGTVCGGGRYDGLVELLGGRPTPGVGFALGLERLIELVSQVQAHEAQASHVCVIPLSDQTTGMALSMAETLRNDIPGIRVEAILGGGSVKSLFKRADKSGAQFALIVGEEEIATQTVAVKPLRDNMEQSRWPLNEELMRFLAGQFNLRSDV